MAIDLALVLCASCAGVAFAGGWLFARLAGRRGWVDAPEHRRLHRTPTPRGGGIGIAAVLATVVFAAYAKGGPGVSLAGGLLVTAGAGLVDDIRPLAPAAKLFAQAVGTLPLALAWPLAPQLATPVPGIVAAWLLAIGLVNAWNFMDGSNGLVTLQALLLGACVAAVLPATDAGGAVAWALVAACIGFLPLNFPRARVFLGDVGSHALGFAAALLLLQAAARGGATAALVWLPLSAVLIDAGVTLGGRLRRGCIPWQAHRDHLYQRIIAAGVGHSAVALAFASWTLVVVGLAVALAAGGADPSLAWAVAGGVYGVGVVTRLAAGYRWPITEPPESKA
ncbi:glycosyltransferase family 4 protein [Arenimonas composti]|nr:lipopolysaccharide biosynthesis protein [Arenimonas composti]